MGKKFDDVVKLVGKKLTLPEKYIPIGPGRGEVPLARVHGTEPHSAKIVIEVLSEHVFPC